MRRPQREHFEGQRGREKRTIRLNGPKRRRRGEGTQKRADGRAKRERGGRGRKDKDGTGDGEKRPKASDARTRHRKKRRIVSASTQEHVGQPKLTYYSRGPILSLYHRPDQHFDLMVPVHYTDVQGSSTFYCTFSQGRTDVRPHDLILAFLCSCQEGNVPKKVRND